MRGCASRVGGIFLLSLVASRTDRSSSFPAEVTIHDALTFAPVLSRRVEIPDSDASSGARPIAPLVVDCWNGPHFFMTTEPPGAHEIALRACFPEDRGDFHVEVPVRVGP